MTVAGAVERLQELLVLEATDGLEPHQDREARSLLDTHPEIDPEGYQLAAAAVQLASGPVAEPLPARLEARLSVLAGGFLAGFRSAAGEARAFAAEQPPPAEVVPLNRSAAAPAARFGWWVAAACLLLALVGWLPRLLPEGGGAAGPVAARVDTPGLPAPVVAPPALERARRVAAAADAMVLPWGTTDDPAGQVVTGSVLWSNELQQGVMRFAGLPVNDPRQAKYQLWIFDAQRDERFPVDGGVFDVAAAEGETLVIIEAKLPVAEPTLFAVTVEPPGGVVVSSRERIVAVAAVG